MDLHAHVDAHRRAVLYARQGRRPGRTTSTSTSTSTSTTSTRSTSSSSSSTSTSSTSTLPTSSSPIQSSSTSRSESSTPAPINAPPRTITSTSTIYSSSSSARPSGSSLPSSNGATTGAARKTGSIVGGVFGAILGLVVLIIIVSFVVRHTRRKRFRREFDEAGSFDAEKFTEYETGAGLGRSKVDGGSLSSASLGYRDGNHTPYGSTNGLVPPRPPSIMERRSTPLSVPATPSAAYGYGNGNMNMNPFSPMATAGAPNSPFALGAGPIPSPYEYEYPLQNPHYHQQYPLQDGFGAPPVPGMHTPAPYGTYVGNTPPGSPFAGGYAYEQCSNMGRGMGAAAEARSTPSPPVKKTSLPDPFASPTSPLSSSPLNSYAHAKELPLPPLSLSPPLPSLPLLLPVTSPLRLQPRPTLSAGPSTCGSTGTCPADPSRDSAYSTAYSEAQVGQAFKVQVQAQGSATPVVYEELRREEGPGGAFGSSSPPPTPAAAEGASLVPPTTVPDTPASAQTNGNGKKNDHRPMSAYTIYDPEDAYGGM